MTLELVADHLVFRFPDVHEDAVLSVTFQRTLRVPDDGHTHWLPPGLGAFPLRDVSTFGDRLPDSWRARGGAMLPMWQGEACWISFSSPTGYPMAVKVAAGKINALTGKPWAEPLDHQEQDFLEAPNQPWVDGFCVTKGTVRQFVAMPLGKGYTAEEQINGAAEFGGIQLLLRPLRGEVWEARKQEMVHVLNNNASELLCYNLCSVEAMGLAPGGSIRQEIAEASERPRDWAPMASRERCFVHLINSTEWQQFAGSAPPTKAPTAADYTRAGLPWFDHYSDKRAIEGSAILDRLQTVLDLGMTKGEKPLDENESFTPPTPVVLGKKAAVSSGDAGAW